MSLNRFLLFTSAAAVMLPCATLAQSARQTPLLITQTINENQRVTLPGNIRSEANAANDQGRVADSLPMEHMLLQLQRSTEQTQALDEFVETLHDPSSPNYHKWLTAAQFGQQFGLAQEDLNTIQSWLTLQGFTVNTVYSNGLLIDFSGTAGAVRKAFNTEIHQLSVNGTTHISNLTNPQIPAALASAIKGVVSLNDFMPHPMSRIKSQYTFSSGGTTYQLVAPADLAKIYNFSPLFAAGTTGTGQTIAVIEDANLYNTADWTTFQSTFGLTAYKGTLTQVHPAPARGVSNCGNPGTGNGDDVETTLDAEWALAAAPGANIEVASCASTNTTFGGFIAMQNLLNTTNATTGPAIMSLSYGECEAENGASSNAAYRALYQQAATQGVSVFVSAGDEGAASCDAGASAATHGIGVSAFASTPYNVAVGGTDFGDTYAGKNTTYWNSTNTASYESAKSYVPEIPWNDSCASELLSSYNGFSTPYGASGFCNSSIGTEYYLNVVGGSGGPSGCFTGTPSTSGVVSGTCAGDPKPSWQSVVGNPSDGVRDIPDVALFAADGVWGHYYPFCFSDIRNGGARCTGAPSSWAGGGGTSFAAPIMAGVQALVNQSHGAQGNPNPVYYHLAAAEYGSAGNSACNSSSGNGVASSCIFYDVTQGDMDVDCTGTNSCYDSSTTTTGGSGRGGRGGRTETIYGVLSTSSTSYAPAFGTGVGWDFATGIGTVNVANLVGSWPK